MRGCRPTTCCTRTTSAWSRRCSTGEVDIGWNTNTAYVALDHRVGGATRILGMRDVDEDWATVIVTRKGRGGRTRRRRSPGGGSRSAAATPGTPRSCRCTTSPSRASTPSASASCCASTPTSASTATPATPSCTSCARSRTGEADAGALSDVVLQRLPRRGPAGGRRARGRLAQPDLLPLQLHRARRFDEELGGAVERRRCWRWTSTTRRCGRRWSSRASAAGCRAIARATRR